MVYPGVQAPGFLKTGEDLMVAKSTVFVGCKLPHGIILEHPTNENQKVQLSGLNKIMIIGATHAMTELDSEFWDAWIAANKNFQPLKTGAIFIAKNSSELQAVAKEYEKVKTGFEPMAQDALGVKPADKN